jgi:sugar/nucleoside kinase (ribokinase family)
MALTITGGIALDFVDQPSRLQGPMLGGSAAYAAMAAAALSKVRVVSAVGDDLPQAALDPMRRAGIDLAEVKVLSGATATWKGTYGRTGGERRTALTSQGVSGGYVPRLSPTTRSSSVLLLGAGDPSVQLAIRRQVGSQAFVGVDTIDHWIDDDAAGVRAVLALVDLIFIARLEAEQLTGQAEPQAVASALALSPRQTLVVKGGASGSWLVRDGASEHVPAYPVAEVVDPTGAGDAYAGALMGSLSLESGYPSWDRMVKAMLYGSAVGSVVVEGRGIASLFALTRELINNRVADLTSG